MKLCRFVLNDAPDQARSGIYHDGKVYETDGERAVGIYEPGRISLLPPLGTPPATRVYQLARCSNGEEFLTYRIQNVTGFVGPNAEISVPPSVTALDFDFHVVGVVSEQAEVVETYEAATFVLGYALLIVLHDADAADEERILGVPLGPSHDLGGALGPYLTTPEDLTEFTVGTQTTSFEWRYRIKVNDVEVANGVVNEAPSFSALVSNASSARAVFPGEVLAWPAVPKPALPDSPLERHLVESDRIEASVDGLGTLVLRLA